jgi:hypothetical protein
MKAILLVLITDGGDIFIAKGVGVDLGGSGSISNDAHDAHGDDSYNEGSSESGLSLLLDQTQVNT